jgi:predicted NAD/FAD-binding protein
MAGAAPASGPGQVGDDGPPDSRKDGRQPYSRRRIAVIGSGIAGLTAAHVLCRSADVTLFEADGRVGGHAHTHDIADPAGGSPLRVDSGFIVHNARTYPYLLRLLRELDVATQESEMSMSVRGLRPGVRGRARPARAVRAAAHRAAPAVSADAP